MADLDNGETLRFDADADADADGPDAVELWSISRLDDAARAAQEEADWKRLGQDASQGWEAEAGYRTFTRGQKVRTRTGQIRTVAQPEGLPGLC